MITCKEDLHNTWIKNDKGELAELYVGLCEKFGFGKFRNFAADLDIISLYSCDDGGTDPWEIIGMEIGEPGEHVRELTLEDLKPQNKEVEWVNGLPPVGVECVFVGIHNNYHCNVSIYHSDGNKIMFLGRVDGFPKESTIENFKDGIDLMVFYSRDGDKPFIPLESEAERKEREELEASYDLYCDFYQDHNPLHKTIESFECSRDKDLWLRTVRKTNYKVKGE